MKYKITIPGRPITKKNSMRLAHGGNRSFPIPSKQFEEYQENAGYYIPYKWKLISHPCNVKCLYYMPIDYQNTKSVIDLVNLLEATDDILVHYGVLEDDNSRIVVSHDGSRVLYDKEAPRVEIEIERVQNVE